jgi:hemoglobin-like flavoprotein/uncharacterized protein YjbI with pentapeptide repeats
MTLNVELLEESFERIKPNAHQFVASFYERLFTKYPEVKPLFAQTDMGKQEKKLLNSLVLVVENIRYPENLAPVLQALGARHIGYGAIPPYYNAVGEVLLETFAEYLQENWTDQVKQSWVDALQAVTDLMLQSAQTTVIETREPEPESAAKLSPDSQIDNTELAAEILEKSFEKIKPKAEEFVVSFYDNLFAAHPEVKPLFAQVDMSKQHKKLLNSLILVVENIRNPEALIPVLHALGARHVGYGTIPKHYAPVSNALLKTFSEYLQEDWHPEVEKAWSDAFRKIISLMLKGANTELASKTPKESADNEVENSREFRQISQKTKQDFSGIESPKISQKTFQKITNLFWELPSWKIILISVFIFALLFLLAGSNAVLTKLLVEGLSPISLFVALILHIKEGPTRRKQFHYQALGRIDAAHGVKVSYARILALQDLNEDGVSLRGLDAEGAELVEINLPKANLSKANLKKTDFSKADLSYADFNYADLSQAQLIGVNLSFANLSFANLSGTNCSSANLNSANLICANLTQANLAGADLRNASLSGATLDNTYLSGANLKGAKITLSELSKAFLQGAIMPDGSKYSG